MNGWRGIYKLDPLPIYDASKRFTSNMYIDDAYMCVSFHVQKHLKIGKGGMILTNDEKAYDWFNKSRYEGRSPIPYNKDNIQTMGWNMYMTPMAAAWGLTLMQAYPNNAEDLSEEYKDLTENDIFNDKT